MVNDHGFHSAQSTVVFPAVPLCRDTSSNAEARKQRDTIQEYKNMLPMLHCYTVQEEHGLMNELQAP